MRRPFMGAPVLTLGFRSNGNLEHPAIITHVWADDVVNVTIFGDNAQKPESYTSVRFVQTRDQAVRARELGGPFTIVAFWNDAESEPALATFPYPPGHIGSITAGTALPPQIQAAEPLEVVMAPSRFTMTPQSPPEVKVEAIIARAKELVAPESVPA